MATASFVRPHAKLRQIVICYTHCDHCKAEHRSFSAPSPCFLCAAIITCIVRVSTAASTPPSFDQYGNRAEPPFYRRNLCRAKIGGVDPLNFHLQYNGV